jgi:hypothetical protein
MEEGKYVLAQLIKLVDCDIQVCVSKETQCRGKRDLHQSPIYIYIYIYIVYIYVYIYILCVCVDTHTRAGSLM